MEQLPVLMTATEVAEQLRVHPSTLRRWVADGTISAVTLPGTRSLRFRRDDIQAILNGERSGAAS